MREKGEEDKTKCGNGRGVTSRGKTSSNFLTIRGRRVAEGSPDRCIARGRDSGGSRPRVTRPDEDVTPLIDRQALALDEFVLHILQGRVVELELPLEGAVGHTAPLAQQRDHLIYDRDKVHPVASFPGTGPAYPCAPS
jgi:hypothetical protein